MMNNSVTISIGGLIFAAVILFVGYIWGRSSVELPPPEIKEVVRWERETFYIHDTITSPPERVEVPVDRPVFVPADTMALFAVWCDYYLKREYELNFSSDSLGVFIVHASVQENKIHSAVSTIQPTRKIVEVEKTVYKVPSLQPWIMFGTSTSFNAQKIQFGVDFKNKYVGGISGLRLNDEVGFTIDFGVKF